MNYFKRLFAFALSAGIVSSVFAIDCLPGVYSGNMSQYSNEFLFELEIGSKDDQMIFVVTRMDSEGERLCSLHTNLSIFSKKGFIWGKQKWNKGRVRDASGILFLTTPDSATCDRVRLQTQRFTYEEIPVYARRIEGREARSFDELKSIYDSLPLR